MEKISNMDLGDWMKAHGIAWFSQFMLTVVDNTRWIQHFKMTKDIVLRICQDLRPYIQYIDTNHKIQIPVKIRIASTLYKLAQGCILRTLLC